MALKAFNCVYPCENYVHCFIATVPQYYLVLLSSHIEYIESNVHRNLSEQSERSLRTYFHDTYLNDHYESTMSTTRDNISKYSTIADQVLIVFIIVLF